MTTQTQAYYMKCLYYTCDQHACSIFSNIYITNANIKLKMNKNISITTTMPDYYCFVDDDDDDEDVDKVGVVASFKDVC